MPAGIDDKVTIEQKLVGSHDLESQDDADIVLAEYDSDPTVTKGSCDTEERCTHGYICAPIMYELL